MKEKTPEDLIVEVLNKPSAAAHVKMAKLVDKVDWGGQKGAHELAQGNGAWTWGGSGKTKGRDARLAARSGVISDDFDFAKPWEWRQA